MISFDFEYYRPDTIEEACSIYKELADLGKDPVYYAGGTEIISYSRADKLGFQAVIDLKGIPDCIVLTNRNNQFVLGAALSLTKICEANIFPLLTEVAKGTADQTSRNRATLGGNICGKIPYREAVLPLLLCEAQAVVASDKGTRTVNLNQIFDQNVLLKPGEFIVQFLVDKQYAALPYKNLKMSRNGGKAEYPVVSVAALKKDGISRFAFSGVCSFPFRSTALEGELNNASLSVEQRISNALEKLPAPVQDNMHGSAGYRQFVLSYSMTTILNALEG